MAQPLKNRRSTVKKIIKISLFGTGGLLLALILASSISNLFLPEAPEDLQKPSEEMLVHASEALRLMKQLGSETWPGLTADIPLIIWNEETAFLMNQSSQLSDWHMLENITIHGLPVYTQPNSKPYQAFAERLSNDKHAGSMATKTQMNIEIIGLFKQNLPPLINQVFPYRLVMLSTDFYLTTLVHETFHAYQADHYPERFIDAERAYAKTSAYESIFEDMRPAWVEEIACLQSAVAEDNLSAQQALVRDFLALRANRRREAGLTPNLELFEKRFEWLEGSAKYVELEIWHRAASGPYQPAESIWEDRGFHDYQNYADRWQTELDNMIRAANDGGDTLFYYSGMLQARLLDDLMPGWKSRMGDPNIWIEDLLEEAVS